MSRAREITGRTDHGDAAEAAGVAAIAATISCLWCESLYRVRDSGGRGQRFCSEGCRRAFHSAVRRWTLTELAAGRLSLIDIKNGFPATRAFENELLDLVITILDKLSVEQLNALPDPVSTLLDRVLDRE